MRFAKYIAALIVFATTLSCTFNSLDEQIGCMEDDGCVEVHARITNYSDCAVESRSAKLPEEARVSSMALAIFPITDDEIQDCIYYDYEVGQKVNFTVDRNKSPFNEGFDDKACAMYVFSNIPNNAEKMGIGKSLAEFKSHALAVSESYYADADFTGLPDTGFPMIGSLGDNISSDGDGKTFILKPGIKTNENPNSLPLVDNVPSDLLNVPMKSLYAKFSFAITIDPIQVVPGNSQSFTMTSYTLHNIPSKVDFDSGTNSESDVINKTFVINDNSVTMEGGSGEGAINFSFYVPERYIEPRISADTFEYPFGSGNSIREEDKNLRQRYKPQLLDENGEERLKATYVTIAGEYLDHNARSWKIWYDIYLGADNYGDFNIIRNTHYINNVVIRGVQNYDDHDVEGSIAVDHRVNIENINKDIPIIENLRFSTLLDSHFEVRPLRIKATDNNFKGTVNVEVIFDDGSENNWIRLEHKNSPTDPTDNGFSSDYLSNGKRKFFTYGLVTGETSEGSLEENSLMNSTEVSFTPSVDGDCVWIYVDQCEDEYGFTDSGDVDVVPRSAKIVITVFDEDGELIENATSEYIINQSKLYPIPYPEDASNHYLIESYEEYLNNYDSDDTFKDNQTSFEGMPWGLEDLQLSNKHMAADPSGLSNYNRLSDQNKKTLNERVNSFYDFYNERHDSGISTPDQKHVRAGQAFCDEIIVTTQGTTHQIGVLGLNEPPKSAVEYCYNKNKRDKNGNIVYSEWYLPAIDEIEDIMRSAYDAFDGVFQAQDYWSCQPSYHRCYFFMSQYFRTSIFSGYTVAGNFDFYVDDVVRARSTRAKFSGEYDNNGKPLFDYNPSGIKIPYDDPENKTYPQEMRLGENGENVNFYIQKGYYRWVTNRGGTYAPLKDGQIDTSAVYTNSQVGDRYEHDKAYIDSSPVWPEFGEDPYREPGNMSRTEKNRVRCVYKKKN